MSGGTPGPGRRGEAPGPGSGLRETEAGFQGWVTDLARLRGWWVYHTHDSRHSEKGWPDLALVRPPRLILAETKTERGRVTADQAAVLHALDQCDGPEVFLWRPSMRATIEGLLA